MTRSRSTTPRRADDSPDPPLVFDRAAAREIDRLAVSEYGMPSILLMENAASRVADAALDMLESVAAPAAVILCGPGNNGGDGLAAARHLANAGVSVTVVLAGGEHGPRGDSAVHLRIAQAMRLPILVPPESPTNAWPDSLSEPLKNAHLIVDALLGTGTTRPVSGVIAHLIALTNRLHATGSAVLSVDLPSGLDCDSGEPLGDAVRADVTVSLVGLKLGFTTLAAQPYLGLVRIVDIGVPGELLSRLGRRTGSGIHPARYAQNDEIDAPDAPSPPGRRDAPQR